MLPFSRVSMKNRSYKKPFLLNKTFFPNHDENRMKNEGNIELARKMFFIKPSNNVRFLLKNRFEWITHFIKEKKVIIELGSGAGLIKEFIKEPNITLTDVKKYSWISQEIDALHLPYADESIDCFILNHMLHHVAKPFQFISSLEKKLKKNGLVIINDPETSFCMRLILKLMKHEGWSYETDPFDKDSIANNPKDPWSANCALAQLLFQNPYKFENHFPNLKIVKNELSEFLIFLLSGGVIAKAPTIQLPKSILNFIHQIDKALIKLFPRLFPLSRKVVLQKRN